MTININFKRFFLVSFVWSLLVGLLSFGYYSNYHTVTKLDDGTIHIKKSIFLKEFNHFVKDGQNLYAEQDPDLLFATKLYVERGLDTFQQYSLNNAEHKMYQEATPCFIVVAALLTAGALIITFE